MAANTIGSLAVQLSVNVARFEKGLNRAEFLAKKRTKAISRAVGAIGIAIGTALGGASLSAARNSAAALSKISDQADKLGLTTDQLQLMRFAAEQAGVKIQSFDVGFQRFTRRVADAAGGQKQLAQTFREFGIALEDSTGKARTSREVFFDFADAIANSDDQGKRILKTFQLFDTEGVDLVRALQKGAQAFRDMEREGRELGVVIDEDVIRSADEADKRLTAMTRVIDAQLRPALVEIAPLLVKTAEGIASMLVNVSKFFRTIGVIKSSNAITVYTDQIGILEKKLDGLRSRADSTEGQFISGLLGIDRAEQQKEIDQTINDIAVLNNAIEQLRSTEKGKPVNLINIPTDEIKKSASETKKTFAEITKELSFQNETLEAQIFGYEERLQITRAIADAEAGIGRSLTTNESEQITRIVKQANDYEKILKRNSEKTTETLDQMTVYAEQAARNMQDAFADYLFDPFQKDGLKGMLDGFVTTMRQMASQAASAGIFNAISSGISGSQNPFIQGASSLFGAVLGGGSSAAPIVEGKIIPRASGGPLAANQLSLVGEKGPELFVSSTAGTVIPNNKLGRISSGMGQVINNITVTAPTGRDSRSASQFGFEIASALSLAQRRNG